MLAFGGWTWKDDGFVDAVPRRDVFSAWEARLKADAQSRDTLHINEFPPLAVLSGPGERSPRIFASNTRGKRSRLSSEP